MTVAGKLLRLAAVALIVSAITVVAFFAGYGAGNAAAAERSPAASLAAPPEPDPQRSGSQDAGSDGARPFDVLWETLAVLEDRYYGDLPDEQQMAYGAVRGVLSQLDDPHTTFLEPEQARAWSAGLDGTFEGIGAAVDEWAEGGVLIVGTFEGQPAEAAGLRQGDVIVAVDDQDVTTLALAEAITLIRGPAGTMVRIQVLRPDEGATFEVELRRERIRVPVVESRLLDHNVGYVRLSEFTSTAPGELKTALKALLSLRPQGLILDLRGNPGGLLSAAVDVGSLFVEGDVLIERSRDGAERRYPSDGKPLVEATPLVVLIDGGSASASEIVAGAIQDAGRGVLVGEPTFGKGSVQTPKFLSDGSMLRVTTSRWFTPADRAIHEQGLEPDILIEMSPEGAGSGNDPQLERAIELLLDDVRSERRM